MLTLKFADTHNMVAFLSKPTESDGFEQIVDFLNAHPVKYALTVNPTIYTSCIEQFWSTDKLKTINGESQLHSLVDGKKIIIIESSVRKDHQLVDENGTDCLPNSTIFEQLALMGFVQVFLEQQLNDLSTHKRIYVAPSHTKKIFANMRRVGKGFSGRVTPLFPTMVVQNQSQMGKDSANLTDPHHTPTIIQPSTQTQKTQKPRKPIKDTQVPQPSDPIENVADKDVHEELGDSLVRAATTASSLEAEQDSGGGPRCQETMGDIIAQTRFESVSKHSNDSLLARGNTLQSDEDRLKLDKLMALCTTLQNRVLDLEKTKTTQHNDIASLKRRIKKLEKKNRSRTHKLKRLYKVGLTARVESSDYEESLGEDASKQGRIDVIDVDKEITLVSVQNVDEEMFDVNVLDGEEVFVTEQEVAVKDVNDEVNVVEEVVEVINTAKLIGDATTVSVATTTTATITIINDITLAQALMEIKSIKPKEKGVV
ncbi:hypothetical protein Tco_1269256, partial [Tanacetum coccineum]